MLIICSLITSKYPDLGAQVKYGGYFFTFFIRAFCSKCVNISINLLICVTQAIHVRWLREKDCVCSSCEPFVLVWTVVYFWLQACPICTAMSLLAPPPINWIYTTKIFSISIEFCYSSSIPYKNNVIHIHKSWYSGQAVCSSYTHRERMERQLAL